MISPMCGVRVWAYPEPTDLRRGYNGLYGLVTQGLKANPLTGDLFLFVNRKRNACKILRWDGTGLCIFMKRLERGQFANVWRSSPDGVLELTSSELALFVEGCRLIGSQRLSPKPVTSF